MAKQSTTINVPFSPIASSKSAFVFRLCTPSLPIVAEKDLLVKGGWWMFCNRLSGVVAVAGVLVKRGVLVSSVLLMKADDAKDIQELEVGE